MHAFIVYIVKLNYKEYIDMKKLNLYLMGTWLLMITAMLQSCDDDGYSLGKFQVQMATVHGTGNNSFYLEADDGSTLFPATSTPYWYQPISGQRVIANYTLLGDNYGAYDYAAKINSLSNVLTKTVEKLDADNEEEIGNSPVLQLEKLWIGNEYLNVVFYMDMPREERHRVSLVENTLAENPEDGYIHLEYRYNDQEDLSGYIRKGIVSFNLKPYFSKEHSHKGIKIKFNLKKEGEKTYTYEFTEDEEKFTEITNPEELIDPEFKFM